MSEIQRVCDAVAGSLRVELAQHATPEIELKRLALGADHGRFFRSWEFSNPERSTGVEYLREPAQGLTTPPVPGAFAAEFQDDFEALDAWFDECQPVLNYLHLWCAAMVLESLAAKCGHLPLAVARDCRWELYDDIEAVRGGLSVAEFPAAANAMRAAVSEACRQMPAAHAAEFRQAFNLK